MNTLIIDTSDNKEVKVGLRVHKKEFILKKKSDQWKSQMVLPLIDEILREHKITMRQLTGIEVNTGPGSFTGLRVGLSIANMLSKLLHIPINQSLTPVVDVLYK